MARGIALVLNSFQIMYSYSQTVISSRVCHEKALLIRRGALTRRLSCRFCRLDILPHWRAPNRRHWWARERLAWRLCRTRWERRCRRLAEEWVEAGINEEPYLLPPDLCKDIRHFRLFTIALECQKLFTSIVCRLGAATEFKRDFHLNLNVRQVSSRWILSLVNYFRLILWRHKARV